MNDQFKKAVELANVYSGFAFGGSAVQGRVKFPMQLLFRARLGIIQTRCAWGV